ncbi:ribonuclease P protein component [Phycicoccus sp. MAQZ13P-2]|uniref:ribonuclease P protein component n=1 Tax=Phycicoccus mangrovi TaxID=2840470 RepID=UPI001C004A6D|nr:ribonuclease P protein component [Phycicoccus mangrovi]MBT9258008.1 ribonuclease P protein component [Phycicoccus mangrovi]MBT9275992.1 ribonuclease P protein component [Phycicoccus mangrovi]
MLPAPNRLRERADFASAVRGRGTTRAGSRLIVVHATRTDARAGCPPRVGFVVSRAVGNAVVRNRTKRRLRHLVAARLAGVPAGVDLVVRANPAAAGASSAELGGALDTLVHKVVGRVGGAS